MRASTGVVRAGSTMGAAFLLALTLALISSPAYGDGGAPRIRQDPQANLADVYAFVGTKYDEPTKEVLNVVVHVHRFAVPADGGAYDRFADDAIYHIHIAHPVTGETLLRYDFRFSSVESRYKDPDTILAYGRGTEIGPITNIGDSRQNYSQTYSVTKVVAGTSTVVGSNLPTPPPNVGARTTPFYNDRDGRAISGATTLDGLDRFTRTALVTLPTGESVFAGPRDDGAYGDVSGIFDLLDPRLLGPGGQGQDGGGKDAFRGFNVLAYAIQIPLETLPVFEYSAMFGDLASPLPAIGSSTGVGVYASVSRRRVTVRELPSDGGGDPGLYSADCNADGYLDIADAVCLLRFLFLGGNRPARVDEVDSWVQVSRMGNPLFDELFVPVGEKHRYHITPPTGDANATTGFAGHARTPELAALFNLIYGTAFVESGRTDLVAIYLPDVIRVDTTTGAARLAGEAGFSRLGFFGGDTTFNGSGWIVPSGWPNGRRFGDDVIDIALTALASGPSYANVIVLGDNVSANDQIFHQVFPYSATPHTGAVNAGN